MGMLDRFKVDRHQAVLVVVDVQERLEPAFPEKDYKGILGAIDLLVKGAEELKNPGGDHRTVPQGVGSYCS